MKKELKKIKNVIKFCKSTEDLVKINDELVNYYNKTKDKEVASLLYDILMSPYIYDKMENPRSILEQDEKIIIDSNDSSVNLDFLTHCCQSNIKEHEQAILNGGDPWASDNFLIDFAEFADIEAHENLILKSGDALAIEDFVRLYFEMEDIFSAKLKDDIKTIIKKHSKAIIDTKDGNMNEYFARHYFEYVDVKAHEKAVVESKNKCAILSFAKNIQGADIKVLEQAIIECGDAEYCYKFAIEVYGANEENLFNVIEKSGNQEYIDKINEIKIARTEPIKEIKKILSNLI